MRLILVGSPEERVRLKAGLNGTPVTIAGEFPTTAAARASGIHADAVLTAPPHDVADDVTPEALTRRELEVLQLLAEGLPNKAIATRLGISGQTVKFHVASLSGKLGATNRTDAVRRGVRRGLVSL